MTDTNKEQPDKTADVSDLATDIEMAFTRRAIEQTQAACKQAQTPNAKGEYLVTECVECDEEIPLARLRIAMKNTRCTDCAAAMERLSRR